MKVLKRDLGSFLKGMKLLAERSDKIVERLVKLEGRPTEKPKARKRVKDPEKEIIKKARNQTALVKVLAVIENSKGGVDTALLKKKTGLEEIKIRNVIFRLKKQGKIKSMGRGVYVIAKE